MTELLYFDNDCISAFLWVDEQSILAQMYPGRIVIPKPVYDELSYPGVQHLKKRIDKMVFLGQASIMTISTDSKAYSIYREMTQEPKKTIALSATAKLPVWRWLLKTAVLSRAII